MKLIKIIKRNTPKRDCHFYNWGGDEKKNYPSYPREYGARCEYNNIFFYRNKDNLLEPNCSECKAYNTIYEKDNLIK